MRLRFTAGMVAIVGVVLVGCSSTPGSPGPTSGDSVTPTTDSLPAGTPNVAHPLDVTKFRNAPCTSLTQGQLQQLNVAGTGKASDSQCGWIDSRQKAKISVTVTFGPAGHGLGDIYGQKDTYKVFKPLADVGGYPAAIALTEDTQSQGICTITVGVSNQQFVDVGVTTGDNAADAKSPCTPNQAVAAAVVATLKG